MRNTFVHIGPRGCGRTTAIAEACRKIGATMVCANYEHARHVKNAFGVNTVSLNDTVGGTVGPYLFDHFTVDSLSVRYEQEINRLRTALEQAEGGREFWKGSHQRVSQTLEQVKRERDELKEEIQAGQETLNQWLEDYEKVERERYEARGLLRVLSVAVRPFASELSERIDAHLRGEGD